MGCERHHHRFTFEAVSTERHCENRAAQSLSDHEMEEIDRTVEWVVRQIGVVSPKTKAEIRRELQSHFEDALESTRSWPQSRRRRQRLLIERFGDPQRIAEYFRDTYSHERKLLSALRFVLTVTLLSLTSLALILLFNRLLGYVSGELTLSSTEVVRIQWASFFTFFLGLFYAVSYEFAKAFKSHSKLKGHLIVGFIFLLLGTALDVAVRHSQPAAAGAVPIGLRNLQLFLENAADTLVYFKIYFLVVATTVVAMDLFFRRELDFSKQTLLYLLCGLPAGLVLNLLNRLSTGDGLQLVGLDDLFLWVTMIAAICVFGSFTRFFVPFFERKYTHLLSA